MARIADDDLLRPTLEHLAAPADGAARPWRLGSQVYVAFFGGAIAVAIIALLNAERLRLGRQAQAFVVACGVAGLAGTVLLVALVDDVPTFAKRAVALLAWGGMWLVQRSADRSVAFHARDEDAYASLWRPGLLAVIAGAIAQGLLVAAVTGDVG